MRGLLSPFESRPFRWLMAGQALSLVGDRLSYLAMVAAMGERTGRFAAAGAGAALSGLAVALLLPSVLLSPWTASRIDRWRRRDVLIRADVARAGVSFALAAALPCLPVPAMLVLIALSSVANVFFLPARVAIVPELVPAGELNRANALGVMAAVLATLGGTLLGGPLVAHGGTRAALALDGASFLLSVLTLLRMPRGHVPLPAAVPEGARRAAWPGAAGFRALLGRREARAGGLLLVCTWVLGALFHVCGTLRLQSLTPRVTDLLSPALAAIGAGGACGAALVGNRMKTRRSLFAGGALVAVAGCMVAFAVAGGKAWVVGAAFAAGLASAPVYVLADTEVLLAVPEGGRGGALAARDFLCKGSFLVLALALGAVATPAAAPLYLLAGAALLLPFGAYYALRRPLSC